MERLLHSEASRVFHFFEEICAIPHGSGNVGAISEYLVDFARRRNLEYVQDAVKNVIIIGEATPGYEAEEPLILQGHMDMVAVKKPGCEKDMKMEGLSLAIDGDWLYAKDTSLGGDDGIAVAYMLAILDSDTIAHPRIEAVFTADEETGMDGARAIDLSICKGKRMLNMDSEEEGIFLTSCAGGARVHGCLPVEYERMTGLRYRISVEGLQGGHSGADIHKERGNSNCLAGRLLFAVQKAADVRLISLEGGLADNAIPRDTGMELLVREEEVEAFEAALLDTAEKMRRELAKKDPDFAVLTLNKESGSFAALTRESSQKAAFLLFILPNGVQAMSADIPGLVQTSLNLGILKLSEEGLHLDISVRSSVGSEKEALLDKLKAILASVGADCEVAGDYPAWEFKSKSVLRDKMIAVYQQLYRKEPKIEAIHAGLECGILSGKIDGLDCVSIGPDMRDIHTTEEQLSIPSVERMWEYIVAVLSRKD